jgi:predicted dienelactone hydrolase
LLDVSDRCAIGRCSLVFLGYSSKRWDKQQQRRVLNLNCSETAGKRVKKSNWKRSLGWIPLSSCGFAMSLLLSCAATAAERIYATYGFIELNIPVKDLEVYAAEGRLSPTLETYAKYLKPAQLQDLREALKKRIELSSEVISQFLYTPTGEKLLERASTLVKAKSQVSSVQALRSAMILASTDAQGLTVLSLLRNYPDAGIQVDVAQGIEVFQGVRRLVGQTNTAISLVQQQSDGVAKTASAAPLPNLLALRQPGKFTWDVLPLSLTDNRPQRLQMTGKVRQYAADVYVPKLTKLQPMPIVVISHGLGSGRKSFRYFAEHLASHGYVVAVPEHPGSSNQQFEALLDGKADDVSRPMEFLDRPLDVSFLLDELGRLSLTDDRLKGRLNFKQVGVMGQSFGGYTALALVGATFSAERIQKDCGPELSKTLNLSLLLQCQVQQLPKKKYVLRDPRVKAAIAVNPMSSSVFGPEGFKTIQAPVMIVSGTQDSIAPPLAEQIEPFTWLPKIEKRLILVDGATHFSTIDELQPSEKVFVTPKELIGRTPDLARSYMRGLGLAFFQTYVQQQPKSAIFLTPASIKSQSMQPLLLRGITSLSSEELERMKNAL